MGPEAQADLQRLRASTAECVAYGISLVPEVRSVCSCPAWGDQFLLVEGHFLVGGVLETLSCPSLCSAIPALSLVTLPPAPAGCPLSISCHISLSSRQ